MLVQFKNLFFVSQELNSIIGTYRMRNSLPY